MNPVLSEVEARLSTRPMRWLVTGAAGFIGSHLVERLLRLGQEVVGLDNFSTGHRANLDDVLASVPSTARGRFHFISGDIRSADDCRRACEGVERVLHQAALGSVPRSFEDPVRTHDTNVTGFLQMLVAARDAKVARFIYASSSSVYGDSQGLPKVEGQEGRALSPYAASKQMNETYAQVFERGYQLPCVGLRYFNVFGPRQDPRGAYAAVVPRWISALLEGKSCEVYGDGETRRDFCFVENAVQANLLAAMAEGEVTGAVYNVAVGQQTSLNALFALIRERVATLRPEAASAQAVHRDERAGDIRASLASVERAAKAFGYAPTHAVGQGLDATVAWYGRKR